MSNNDKNDGDMDGEEQLELTTPQDDAWQPTDKRFDDFDEDEVFEESDRDTDFASMYVEVEEEEQDLPDESAEEQLELENTVEDFPPRESSDDTDEDTEQEDHSWGDFVDETQNDDATTEQWSGTEQDHATTSDRDSTGEQIMPGPGASSTAMEEDWEEEEYYDEEDDSELVLPLGLIIVGVIALVLLAAGGYGVMQDRAALKEEIRQLQATLATTAAPKEVAETRAATQEMSQRNQELEQSLEQLSRENRSLETINAGLEKQLQAQQDALTKPAPIPTPDAKPKPEPTPAPAAKPATTTATTSAASSTPAAGTWFVNFGSYAQRATAESWAKRLQPGAGSVVVSTGEKDGKTFYRVRVIDLTSRELADSTARKLEQKYGLVKLWIGKAG